MKNEVIGGNHRTVAAWLLGRTHIRALRVDAVAGWTIPLDESNRKPIEEAIGFDFFIIFYEAEHQQTFGGHDCSSSVSRATLALCISWLNCRMVFPRCCEH